MALLRLLRVPEENKQLLIKQPTSEEVNEVVKCLKKRKCPGPDGMTTEFYKKNWGIVGEDVFKAIKQYFATGFMFGFLNCTVVSMIPKTEHLETMRAYRPIACYNVLYKINSKILMNMMAPCLDKLISKNQSAFVNGRHIIDNVLLMLEMVNKYHWDKCPPRVAIKVDLMKAYDMLSWECL
ncbi:hypothetical protein LIER_22994 [Lithospermum erythrorhizon]|uniref:Reverse transcriptase domain-containing protein n=1 Tax=Lithospermum erythrorhizon TaxID=34254 RepID=A0AAV3QVU0_LITER